MRIVLSIAHGSPISSEKEQSVAVGKKLRKCNVAVDVLSFGDIDENAEKLDAFMAAVTKTTIATSSQCPRARCLPTFCSTPTSSLDELAMHSGGTGLAAAAAAANS